jgi:hypothetical protein
MKLPNQDGFVRAVKALSPYLDDLVVAGAWCHRLLHFHPLARPPSFAPLMSEDADVVTPEQLAPRSPSIAEALAAAGFRPSLSGTGQLPVSRYYPDRDDEGFYLEFIAPLRGGGHTRRGEVDDTLAISGILASKLRHVQLLLFEPWRCELSRRQGFEIGGEDVAVLVASPASYLAQKVLALERRKHPAKKSKDALYIHDTLMMFGDALPGFRDQAARVLQQLPPRTRKAFHELRAALFRDHALLVVAADIAAATGRASPPSPVTIGAVCALGLEQLFGP